MGPDRQGLRAGLRRLRHRSPTTSWRPSTPRRCARSRSTSSSTSRRSTHLLRQRLLPRSRQGLEALRPAGPGHGGRGQGRHRPLRAAHQAVPGRHPPERRATAAVDDGLRRRDQRPGRRSPSSTRSSTSTSPTRSWRWPPSSSSRSPTDFEPDRFKDTLPRGRARADREEGRGRGGRRRRSARSSRTRWSTSWPPWRRRWPRPRRPGPAIPRPTMPTTRPRTTRSTAPEGGQEGPQGAGQEGPGQEGHGPPQVRLTSRTWLTNVRNPHVGEPASWTGWAQRATKYLACGWWQMRADVVCSGWYW